MELVLSDLDEATVASFERLEPFGAGNPEPLFFSRNLRRKSEPQVLSRETLKFWVTDGQATYQAIGFGMASLRDNLREAESFDLVYTARLDNWAGTATVLLEVKDIFFK
jgi:single-stranded-DNA-specific exonuclease